VCICRGTLERERQRDRETERQRETERDRERERGGVYLPQPIFTGLSLQMGPIISGWSGVATLSKLLKIPGILCRI